VAAVTDQSTAEVTTFVYDGNGNRVKKVDASGTTYYVGGIYEVQGDTVTKYYYAAGQRVAMRQDGVVYYLHADHLGSTSLATDASGQPLARVLYYPYGEERYRDGTLPTDYTYTGQRVEESLGGLMDYNARFYDVALGRFISADTIVPGVGSQALNRYMYVNGNPLKYTDPSGHCLWVGEGGDTDVDDNKAYMAYMRKRRAEMKDKAFACVPGYGCFDTKHLRHFPDEKSQAEYWQEFRDEAAMGGDFPIELSQGQPGGSRLTIVYGVSSLEEKQYEGVAMAIYQDYAREFEGFQIAVSNYANQDQPSDYLGLVAAMRGQSPDSLLWELGPVSYTDEETPPRSGLFWDNTRNTEFTPRVCDAGGCRNVSWPAALQVDPINDSTLWRRQSLHSSYGWGAYWTDITYNEDGGISQYLCTYCSTDGW
jgi:RHS repeat-associated protein